AAERQAKRVRRHHAEPEHVKACARLLKEIEQAKGVLLDPEKRKKYDALLRARAGIQAAPGKDEDLVTVEPAEDEDDTAAVEEEEEAPAEPVRAKKRHVEEDDEEPVRPAKGKKKRREEEDEDEEPVRPGKGKKVPLKGKAGRKRRDEDEEEEDEEKKKS